MSRSICWPTRLSDFSDRSIDLASILIIDNELGITVALQSIMEGEGRQITGAGKKGEGTPRA